MDSFLCTFNSYMDMERLKMKIIKISSIDNKPYLFNKIMTLNAYYKCGGVYDIGKGEVKFNVWDNVYKAFKKGLEELKIKFTETEE